MGIIGGMIGLILAAVGLLVTLILGIAGSIIIVPVIIGVAITLALLGGAFAVPVIVVLVLIGILFWSPSLWLGIAVVIYLIHRIARNRGCIMIRRR